MLFFSFFLSFLLVFEASLPFLYAACVTLLVSCPLDHSRRISGFLSAAPRTPSFAVLRAKKLMYICQGGFRSGFSCLTFGIFYVHGLGKCVVLVNFPGRNFEMVERVFITGWWKLL